MAHCCERVGTFPFSLDLKTIFKGKATKELRTDQFKYLCFCLISENVGKGTAASVGTKISITISTFKIFCELSRI